MQALTHYHHNHSSFAFSQCNADLESRTYDGLTPLHIAVARDAHEIATLLLACGADLNAQYDDNSDSTPITLCVSGKVK